MGNFGAPMCWISIFILTMGSSCEASDEDRQEYIVYMGALPDVTYSPSSHHLSILQSVIEFLCDVGLDDKQIRLISGQKSSCPKGSVRGSPRDLNYPSMAAQVEDGKSFSCKFPRRVKNVGQANSTYKASIFPITKFDIKVVPSVLSFQTLHEEKSFDVIVNGSGFPVNSFMSTSLV